MSNPRIVPLARLVEARLRGVNPRNNDREVALSVSAAQQRGLVLPTRAHTVQAARTHDGVVFLRATNAHEQFNDYVGWKPQGAPLQCWRLAESLPDNVFAASLEVRRWSFSHVDMRIHVRPESDVLRTYAQNIAWDERFVQFQSTPLRLLGREDAHSLLDGAACFLWQTGNDAMALSRRISVDDDTLVRTPSVGGRVMRFMIAGVIVTCMIPVVMGVLGWQVRKNMQLLDLMTQSEAMPDTVRQSIAATLREYPKSTMAVPSALIGLIAMHWMVRSPAWHTANEIFTGVQTWIPSFEDEHAVRSALFTYAQHEIVAQRVQQHFSDDDGLDYVHQFRMRSGSPRLPKVSAASQVAGFLNGAHGARN